MFFTIMAVKVFSRIERDIADLTLKWAGYLWWHSDMMLYTTSYLHLWAEKQDLQNF